MDTPRRLSGFLGDLSVLHADVFISYSRKDKAFVRALAERLAEAGRQAWGDWQDIPPTAKWLEEIYAGIEAANTFVFVLSPDSITSHPCMQEVIHAVNSKKRIIPLLIHTVDPESVVEALRELNWIDFRPEGSFERAFQQMFFALDTDLEYWRMAARMLTRAKEWESREYDASTVLQGKELTEGELWLAEGATKKPGPNKLQTEFITASRRVANTRQRRTISFLSVASVVLTALTVLSFVLYQVSQTQKAQIEQELMITRADQYASQGTIAMIHNQPDRALLFGVESYETFNDLNSRDALSAALADNVSLASIFTDTASPTQAPQGDALGSAFFRPADHSLIAISGAGRVIHWDITTHQERQLFQIPHWDYQASEALLSPDGNRLAVMLTGNSDTFQLWSLTTGALLWQRSLNISVCAFRFSPDGGMITVAICTYTPSIQLSWWSVSTGTLIGKPIVFSTVPFPPFMNLPTMVLSPDGTRLAGMTCSAYPVCEVNLWDTAQGHLLWHQTIQWMRPNTLAFSQDGKQLVSTTANQVQVWQSTTGKEIESFTADLNQIFASAFSPDGREIAFGGCVDSACTQGQIILREIDPNVINSRPLVLPPLEKLLSGHVNRALQVSFSPDGSQLLSIDLSNHLFLWDKNESGFGHRFITANEWTGDTGTLNNLSFSPDGKYVAAADSLTDLASYGPTTLWNAVSGNIIATLPGVWSPLFSPNGKYFVAYTTISNGTTPQFILTLFATATHQVIRSFGESPCDLTLFARSYLSFSANGQMLLEPCYLANPIRVQINTWDVRTGRLLHQQVLSGSDRKGIDSVNPDYFMAPVVKISSDTRITALSLGQTLYLWNTVTGQQVASLHSKSSDLIADFAFSPDSKTLAAINDQGITSVWSLEAKRQIDTIDNTQVNDLGILAEGAPLEGQVAFSPDGKFLASLWGNSGTLVQVAQPQLPLFIHLTSVNPGHNPITTMAFYPHSDALAWIVDQYQAIMVRDLDPVNWVQQACQRLALPLQQCISAPVPAN